MLEAADVAQECQEWHRTAARDAPHPLLVAATIAKIERSSFCKGVCHVGCIDQSQAGRKTWTGFIENNHEIQIRLEHDLPSTCECTYSRANCIVHLKAIESF